MSLDSGVSSLEKATDLGTNPEAQARRWKLELKLADKRETTWRKKVADIYKLYTPETPANNSFNILWTNTETLRQSVYNSLPQPDARRRYQDEDPLGMAVGEVLTRSLEFSQDTYDFDAVIKGDVLSMLLPGRAVSRVKYMPDITKVDAVEEPPTEAYEEIKWEQVICERVQWDDFRILCAAKTWDEVTAIGFRHRFTREDCEEKFGDDIGGKIPLDAADDEDVKKSEVKELFKTAEVWEIWDKDEKQVVWICKTYDTPCKTQADPLELSGFFPIPRPLYAIENDKTLVPAALYTQYEQQAKELNKISLRISKLTDALKVRGIYDSTLTELSELMKGQDNDLIPAVNVTALIDRGGLDKAIWMMPIKDAAEVIKILEERREAAKQVIYELMGVSDIMRAASDPKETFGAQKIKTQWGTQRLQRMQMEVQRYIRDLIRLKAEIIAEKFQPETLEKMTLVKLPHQAEVDAQKAQAMQQYQQAVKAAPPGQPVPPPPQLPDPVTWEKVIEAMRNDATRTYRVDIETDSTLAATQDADMDGLKLVLTGLAEVMNAFGPAVEKGAMDIDMLKELMLVVCRRSKMGTAVEDVINKMKQPKQPVDPEAGKAQAAQQLEQVKAQLNDKLNQAQIAADVRAEESKAKIEAQLQAHEQMVQAQQNEHQNALEAQRAVAQANLDAALEKQRLFYEAKEADKVDAFNRFKVDADNKRAIKVAEISAKATTDKAEQAADAKADADFGGEKKKKPMDAVKDMHGELMQHIKQLAEDAAAPTRMERGPDGRVSKITKGKRVMNVSRDDKGMTIQ